jgi:phage shock protein A
MFESLRRAFREAVENFRYELHRDEIPEAADRLLAAMAREVTDARMRLDELESEVTRVRAEGKEEEEAARTCLRREEMARGIGDGETERVAREFAARHLRRKLLLDEKADVLEREIAERRTEVEEMTARLKEARTERESLTASAGRAQARSRIQEADDLFSRMDEMAERIRDMEARAGAAEDIASLGLDGDAGFPPGEAAAGSEPLSAEELEDRLRELKRRMRTE